MPSAIPGARFMDPGGARAHREPGARRRARSCDGFINGLHKAPYFGASVDFAEHRGYVPGDDIRRMDWRCGRAPTATTSRSTRPSRTRTSRCCSTCRSRWTTAAAASPSSTTRASSTACLTNLVHHQRDRVGLRHLRQRRRRARAAVGQAHGRRAAHARPAEAGPAGQPEGAAAQAGRALRPPRRAGPDLGFLRGARRRSRRGRAAALPRQRRRSSSTCSTRRSSSSASPTRQRSRISRRGEQMPVVPDAFRKEYRSLVARAHRRAAAALLGKCASTTRCSTRRSRSTTRSIDTWRAERRMMKSPVACHFSRRCSSSRLAALAIPVLIHLTQREKKQIVQLSVADVRAADPVPVGPAPEDSRTGCCCCVRLAALALIIAAFARPFLWRPDAADRPSGRARARWSCCSTRATAWATATAGSAREAAARDAIDRPGARRPRLGRAVLRRAPTSRCGRRPSAIALDRGDRRRQARRRRHAVRARR